MYDDEFLSIIGPNPTFSLIGQTSKDPIFHEAVVWYKAKDEMWFAQNAGAPDAGTGTDKSAVLYKISLKEADAVKNERNAVGKVKIQLVEHSPPIPNPNGEFQRPRSAGPDLTRIPRRHSVQGEAPLRRLRPG